MKFREGDEPAMVVVAATVTVAVACLFCVELATILSSDICDRLLVQ